jgi:hypothetical protein
MLFCPSVAPLYPAAGLAVASLACGFYSTPQKKAFLALLTPDQRAAFGAIVRRRLWTYVCSMALGSVAGYAALTFGGMRGAGGAAASVAVMMGVSYVCYALWPKGAFMLEYLTTAQQVRAWVDMYRRMVRLFHAGFLLGLLAYAVLVWNLALCKE